VKVIGGGRIADGFVVTAVVKAAMVARLRDIHHMYHVPGLKTWSGKQLFLGVYVRLKREESGELELSTGCHAWARSCDADVTTTCTFGRLEIVCWTCKC
jgi:hypothetical protein